MARTKAGLAVTYRDKQALSEAIGPDSIIPVAKVYDADLIVDLVNYVSSLEEMVLCSDAYRCELCHLVYDIDDIEPDSLIMNKRYCRECWPKVPTSTEAWTARHLSRVRHRKIVKRKTSAKRAATA